MLLSGETLWEDEEPRAVCESVRRGKWSFDQAPHCWDAKPEGAKALIRSMVGLAKDPSVCLWCRW